MLAMSDKMILSLSSMEGLDNEVSRLIAAISSTLTDEKDKAAISITVSLSRVKDTDSMVEVSYKVTPKYPAKSRMMLAHTDLVGNLLVDATPAQRNLFPEPKLEAVQNG